MGTHCATERTRAREPRPGDPDPGSRAQGPGPEDPGLGARVRVPFPGPVTRTRDPGPGMVEGLAPVDGFGGRWEGWERAGAERVVGRVAALGWGRGQGMRICWQ